MGWALAFLLVVSASARAERIEVTGSGMVDVGVGAFSGDKAAEAKNVFTADLKRTLMINPLSGAAEKYVATATVSENGLSGKLYDARAQRDIINKNYSGNWRYATHQFADDVTLAATGVKGFATSRIAFISNQTGKKELYTADIDGANVRQMTSDQTISNAPSWSKDGSMIAYTSYKSGYPDVYVIKLANGSRTRVAYFPGINSGASFSPDGTQLALTLSKDGNPEIYIMPSGGGNPTRLTRTRGAETSPSWDPAGDRLVYSSDDRGSPQLYILPAAPGAESDRVQTNSLFCTKPDWSPDGKKFAYTTRTGGEFQVAVHDLAARSSTQLTKGEDPSWTRNSRQAVFSRNGQLFIVDTVTGNTAPIDTGLKDCTEPAVSR